ncbi:MAG: ribose-phosphate pyrophosphokinase, partial [Gammaproteobacteria bacterium]|nr:ribose-phosphate pyrophosphokinase [Gammaproteobacteria bacterium]
DVAPALINNCNNISNDRFLQYIISDFEKLPILISPDAGSNKKANKLAVDFGFELVKCDKERNTKTGKLSGFEVFTNSLNGKDCLIVDDICDGGGTFLGLAKELKNKGAGNIYLFVTHGIFSKGTEIFRELFSGLYCTNSFSDLESNNVNQIKIQL